ncbi:MAG: OB-fold domain-containing protein [Burkholderiaceae bacterium]
MSEAKPTPAARPEPRPRVIPAPRTLPESQAYWDAADQGRLLVKRCRGCGRAHHYGRDVCPFCWSTDTVWEQASGQGRLYSFSTMGKGVAAYTLAFVTLDEGPTMMTNIVDCDPATLVVEQRVRVVFKPSDGGHAVPMFTPA